MYMNPYVYESVCMCIIMLHKLIIACLSLLLKNVKSGCHIIIGMKETSVECGNLRATIEKIFVDALYCN